MQQQSQQWRRSGRSGGGPPPPCLFHLRGFCRFGAACRFSHDVTEQASAALPLHHRQAVHSHAAAGLATAAACDSPGSGQATTSSSATVPWRFRIMSYNVLADCLAHEHAAELYSSAPRFALEWGYRSGLILRWAAWKGSGWMLGGLNERGRLLLQCSVARPGRAAL